MTEIALTTNQIDLMRHAMGSSHAGTTMGWRNYFCGEDPDILKLAELGLMRKFREASDVLPDPMYMVTDEGIAWLRKAGFTVKTK